MTRGKTRKRKSMWRGIGYLVLAAMTLLVAGFIVRRDLGPALWFYVTHRAPPHQAAEPSRGSGGGQAKAALESASGSIEAGSGPAARPAAADNGAAVAVDRNAPAGAPREELTAPERRALDEIIRKRAK